jgi:hypothetical protein
MHRDRPPRTPESRSGFRVKPSHESGTYNFGKKHKAPTRVHRGEVDEDDVREDLRNWRIGEAAISR